MAAHTERAGPTLDISDGGLRLVLRAIQVGPLLILVLLCALLTLLSPFFLTGDNLLVQVAPLAALAVGQLFVILVGGIDLSVGSLIALTTVRAQAALGSLDLRRRR